MQTPNSSGATGGDFWKSLGTVGLSAAFPLVGGVLSSLTSGLDLFGTGTSDSSSDPTGDDPWKKMGDVGYYNAHGSLGAANVHADHTRALDEHRNSAMAVNAASDINRAADNMQSSVGTQTNLARQGADRANSALRRNTFDVLKGGNANPAAMVAAAGKIGEASGANNMNLLATAGNLNQSAQAQSGALRGQAANTLLQDSDLRYKQYVTPMEMQVNNAAYGLYGGLADTNAHSKQFDAIQDQPLGGFAAALGAAGAQTLSDGAMAGLFTDVTRKDSATDVTPGAKQLSNIGAGSSYNAPPPMQGPGLSYMNNNGANAFQQWLAQMQSQKLNNGGYSFLGG